ncbi:MAG: PAS domain S-box protein, partial [Acidobacteriaceae bacterium]
MRWRLQRSARDTIVKPVEESRTRPHGWTTAPVAGSEGAIRAFQGSDSQYRLLFESNPIPMWVFHRETLHFLAVNQAAVRQYGYSEEQFLRMTIADIRPTETVPDLMLDVARRRHGLQEPEVWKHCRKDGTIIDVEVVCHDLKFQESDAMLVAAYDVTARARAQEKARQAEEKYRAIFDNAVVGIFQHTPEGRPINVNPAFARMHGYDSPKELLAEVTNA